MNSEIQNEEATEVKKEQHPIFQVTTVSKYSALALFIILPFLGGWVGYTYALKTVVENKLALTDENQHVLEEYKLKKQVNELVAEIALYEKEKNTETINYEEGVMVYGDFTLVQKESSPCNAMGDIDCVNETYHFNGVTTVEGFVLIDSKGCPCFVILPKELDKLPHRVTGLDGVAADQYRRMFGVGFTELNVMAEKVHQASGGEDVLFATLEISGLEFSIGQSKSGPSANTEILSIIATSTQPKPDYEEIINEYSGE